MSIIWLLLFLCPKYTQVLPSLNYNDAAVATQNKPPLLPAARKIREAYLAWKNNPTSTVQKLALIEAFPTTANEFSAVFDPKDFGQLYDGHEYIFALMKIGETYPNPVLRRCIAIGKSVRGVSDAPAYLHETIVKLGIAHPQLFAREVSRLANTERAYLFRFLANEESIGDDPDYENLTHLMSKNHFSSYAGELQGAKQWRLRQPNH